MPRMLRASSFVIAATVLAFGCPSHGPVYPSGDDDAASAADAALHVKVAELEAKRAAGVSGLVEMVHGGDAAARKLALRGLGRIGGNDAVGVLDEVMARGEGSALADAIAARGVAAALDEPADAGNDEREAVGAKIAAAMVRCGTACAQVGLEAIGRAGGAAQEAVLVSALGDHETAATAALALGRYGRRKIVQSPAAEAALAGIAASSDASVRYAATFALARATAPKPATASAQSPTPSTPSRSVPSPSTLTLSRALSPATAPTSLTQTLSRSLSPAAEAMQVQSLRPPQAQSHPTQTLSRLRSLTAAPTSSTQRLSQSLSPAAARVQPAQAQATPAQATPAQATQAQATQAQATQMQTLSQSLSPGVAALERLIGDREPEIRATAISGLARRKQVAAAEREIESALGDADWRVAVEAVRALAGDAGDEAGRDAVVASLGALIERAREHDGERTQVVVEAMRTLIDHPPADKAAIAMLVEIAAHARVATSAMAPRSRGWITALAATAREVAEHTARFDLYAVDRGDLPEAYVFSLAAQLATGQPLAVRRSYLRPTLASRDVRVRAGALAVLASTWRDGDADDRRAIIATLVAAIGSSDVVLASESIDAATAVYDAIGDASADRAALDSAIVARAARERDPELGAALVELIGKRAIAGGVGACRAGLAGHPVLARAAAECLKALGEGGAPPPIGAAEPPPAPVSVARVIGKVVRWHLTTSRGDIAIEFDPDVAPWNVAAIVALTERGFYDHIDFHRVVPDFVVQGGDPTMSGDGGPGFTTPAEPATLLDSVSFTVGGVGMADAGRDSAGSQWFVMHSAAPQLDGRYTCVGRVVSGQNVADSLLIGDRVEHATVEIRPRERAAPQTARK